MAGIGWRLERMLGRDTLGSSLGALLTGVAVTSGPWLLTTLVLVLVRAAATGDDADAMRQVERIITIVYAVVIVGTAPIDIVVSRHASDQVYARRPDRIAAPLVRAVAATVLGFAALGATALWFAGSAPRLLVPGAVLAAVVAGQWLLLSAAGGLASPGIILRAFGFGAPLTVLGAIGWGQLAGADGYLGGFVVGQAVTLGALLHGTLRALPIEQDESARLLPSFGAYWMLATAALAFHAGLWVDKVVVFVHAGGDVAAPYAAAAAVAWLSVVPACAVLFVRVETRFYARFRDYYGALHTGASLGHLERLAVALRDEIERTLATTIAVQAGVTMLALLAIPLAAPALGLSAFSTTLAWLVVGSALQLVAMTATLLLYYFDFRREALVTALLQMAANAAATAIVPVGPLLGVGYVIACGLACACALRLLRAGVDTLLVRTFQSQPYATEDATDAT